MDCPQANDALPRLKAIKKIENKLNQRAQCITYEYAKDVPLGISYGYYSIDKLGLYFSLRFNDQVFKAMRKNDEKSERPELNLSLGLNYKVYKPIWIFAGVGYTGVGSWKYEGYKEGEPGFFLHSAFSPEIGVLGQLGPVVLRYTFQYRMPFYEEDQEKIGKIRHVFGIGFCF